MLVDTTGIKKADLKDAAPQIFKNLPPLFIAENIEKASPTLQAYYLLSDTVQFVLRNTVTQRLIIK